MAPHSSTLAWKNPMDGGTWWAAVHGVAKSRTRLSDFTFTVSLSCIGEGNGNPLQCSCLENPRDGGAWWAAVYGVTQSRTRLKWRSSSSFLTFISMLPCILILSLFLTHKRVLLFYSDNSCLDLPILMDHHILLHYHFPLRIIFLVP